MSDSANAGRRSGGQASESTSTSLLQRVKSRDSGAWERLVHLYAPLIYRWCRQSTLPPEDAADVAQEVFGAVVVGIADFRGQGHQGSFRAWLRTITQNKIFDHFRRRQGRAEGKGGTAAQQQLLQVPQPSEPSELSDPPEAEDALWRRAVELVRAEFENRTWQAFWSVAIDGQSSADVAAELEVSVDTVYQAKSRVLRRLRQELSDLETTD